MQRIPDDRSTGAVAQRHRCAARRVAAGAFAAAAIALVCSTAAREVPPSPLDGPVLAWRNLGPGHMSGRITDVAVPRADRSVLVVGTATGGVWASTNRGTTWTSVFDRGGTASIGAVAIDDHDPAVIWVGTGEANASSYTSWGDGVYRSADGGRTWVHAGLRESRHIARVVIDPHAQTRVLVAALGPLWGPGGDRGLFESVDQGREWRRLPVGDHGSGVGDIALHPTSPGVMYAATWNRRAHRFDDFDSVGIDVLPGGGLFRSADRGASWTRLTDGLPAARVGRIGIAIAPSRPSTVYAIVEVAPRVVTLPTATLERLRAWLAADTPPEAAALAEARTALIAAAGPDGAGDVAVAQLGRAEQVQLRVLLDLPPLDTGGGIFRSDDDGARWHRVSALNEREPYYSKLRVNPRDAEHVYALLVRVWESRDGGRVFRQTDWAFSSWLSSAHIHGDFHALWIDPDDPRALIAGTDGGLYTSYDAGRHWENHPMPLGQFAAVAVDMRRPYFVYGGLQDNGTWGGPSATRHRAGVTDADWYKVVTADGGPVAVDPRDHRVVYASWQYGNLLRIDLATGARVPIRPRADRGAPPLRFNFTTPFVLSPHDPSTIYLGANRVLRSADRGDTWTTTSGDLTHGVPHPLTGEGATISTLAESPARRGLLWVGTDDGRMQRSQDGGLTWQDVTPRLEGRQGPSPWVSRVEPSPHGADTVMVSLDAHRDNDRRPYLLRSDDAGLSWRLVTAGLPAEGCVNVVRADPRNPDLWFAGTETGVYATLDGGARWQRLEAGLPTVPVDDLVVHPRDGDLVAGTHGRGVYLLDISPLQQWRSDVAARPLHLFTPEPVVRWHVDLTRNKGTSGSRRFVAPNPFADLVQEGDASGQAPPGANVYVWLAAASELRLEVEDGRGTRVRSLRADGRAGLNLLRWDLRGAPLPPPAPWRAVAGNDAQRLAQLPARPGPLVDPGVYRLVVTAGGRSAEARLDVLADTGLP